MNKTNPLENLRRRFEEKAPKNIQEEMMQRANRAIEILIQSVPLSNEALLEIAEFLPVYDPDGEYPPGLKVRVLDESGNTQVVQAAEIGAVSLVVDIGNVRG